MLAHRHAASQYVFVHHLIIKLHTQNPEMTKMAVLNTDRNGYWTRSRDVKDCPMFFLENKCQLWNDGRSLIIQNNKKTNRQIHLLKFAHETVINRSEHTKIRSN